MVLLQIFIEYPDANLIQPNPDPSRVERSSNLTLAVRSPDLSRVPYGTPYRRSVDVSLAAWADKTRFNGAAYLQIIGSKSVAYKLLSWPQSLKIKKKTKYKSGPFSAYSAA